MGSKLVSKLKKDKGFVFIGRIGSKDCQEKKASFKRDTV